MIALKHLAIFVSVLAGGFLWGEMSAADRGRRGEAARVL
jgi:hypothetical protein